MEHGWEAARGRYMGRLEALGAVLRGVEQVSRLEPGALDRAGKRALGGLLEQTDRQLAKLHKNTFHIAIVGLEKAGKSTFLNAWLRNDLLPNEEERCTYTTTELRSAASEVEQRVVVEFLTREEFDQTCAGYRELARGVGAEATNARKDLEEIEAHRATIEENLGRPTRTVPFQNIEEIRDDLWGYIADPGAARSIRSVTIYSHQLLGERGFVFHDVPGYNSPISLHKEMARQELARADVIIFLTNLSAKVSLVEAELQMLDVADREDPMIKASDKMFVFLNKVDMCGDHTGFTRRHTRAITEWCDTHGKCRPERVIPGSAGAYLMEHATHIRRDTSEMLGSAVESLARVAPPFGDGVQHLQDEIERYIQHDRAEVLGRRCDSLVREGLALARAVMSHLDKNFPQSIRELEARQRELDIERFHDWFEGVWADFVRDFETYWHERVEPRDDPDAPAGRHQRFEMLRQDYEEIVARLQADHFIPLDEIQRQYQRETDGFTQPLKANLAVRSRLIQRNVRPGLERLTENLGSALIDITREVQEQVRASFFGIEEIAAEVSPSGSQEMYHERLRHGLAALFHRHARPATDIFLRTPRGTPDRVQNMLEFYSDDIDLLRLFYRGEEEHKKLRRFLEIGQWSLPEELERPVPQEAASGGGSMLDAILSTTPLQKTSRSLEGVVEEITGDCQVFVDYLLHSVYHAAGLESYCLEELRRLRRYLLDEGGAKREIRKLLTRAYTLNDPRLRDSLGEELMNIEHLRQVLDRKRALEEALARLPARAA